MVDLTEYSLQCKPTVGGLQSEELVYQAADLGMVDALTRWDSSLGSISGHRFWNACRTQWSGVQSGALQSEGQRSRATDLESRHAVTWELKSGRTLGLGGHMVWEATGLGSPATSHPSERRGIEDPST